MRGGNVAIIRVNSENRGTLVFEHFVSEIGSRMLAR